MEMSEDDKILLRNVSSLLIRLTELLKLLPLVLCLNWRIKRNRVFQLCGVFFSFKPFLWKLQVLQHAVLIHKDNAHQ